MIICLFTLVLCYACVICVRICNRYLDKRPLYSAIVRNPRLALRAARLYALGRSSDKVTRTPIVRVNKITYVSSNGDAREGQSLDKKTLTFIDRHSYPHCCISYTYEGCFDFNMVLTGGLDKTHVIEEVNSAVLKRLDIVPGNNTLYAVEYENSDERLPEDKKDQIISFFGPKGTPPDYGFFLFMPPLEDKVVLVKGIEQSYRIDFEKKTIHLDID